MRITLQPGFILHQRPYRETSVLLDAFTLDYGRIALIAKGVRKPHAKLRAILQPFQPLLFTFQGKGELMLLNTAELNGTPNRLLGDCLLSGFYLNEVLMRLLPKSDPHARLYDRYQQTLSALQGVEVANQKALRLFEKTLLEELGYGLQLGHVRADCYYRFHPESGFTLCDTLTLSSNVFTGKNLLAFSSEQLEDEMILRDAKRLMRLALLSLLDEQPLNSRKLFIGNSSDG